MDIADIELATQQAIPDWTVTVELANPTQSDPLNTAPIIVYATRKRDGKIFTSPLYKRPEADADALVRGMRRDLAKIK